MNRALRVCLATGSFLAVAGASFGAFAIPGDADQEVDVCTMHAQTYVMLRNNLTQVRWTQKQMRESVFCSPAEVDRYMAPLDFSARLMLEHVRASAERDGCPLPEAK